MLMAVFFFKLFAVMMCITVTYDLTSFPSTRSSPPVVVLVLVHRATPDQDCWHRFQHQRIMTNLGFLTYIMSELTKKLTICLYETLWPAFRSPDAHMVPRLSELTRRTQSGDAFTVVWKRRSSLQAYLNHESWTNSRRSIFGDKHVQCGKSMEIPWFPE